MRGEMGEMRGERGGKERGVAWKSKRRKHMQAGLCVKQIYT